MCCAATALSLSVSTAVGAAAAAVVAVAALQRKGFYYVQLDALLLLVSVALGSFIFLDIYIVHLCMYIHMYNICVWVHLGELSLNAYVQRRNVNLDAIQNNVMQSLTHLTV